MNIMVRWYHSIFAYVAWLIHRYVEWVRVGRRFEIQGYLTLGFYVVVTPIAAVLAYCATDAWSRLIWIVGTVSCARYLVLIAWSTWQFRTGRR